MPGLPRYYTGMTDMWETFFFSFAGDHDAVGMEMVAGIGV